MSILQKRAWINLAGAVGLVVTAGIFLEVLMYINAKINILFDEPCLFEIGRESCTDFFMVPHLIYRVL